MKTANVKLYLLYIDLSLFCVHFFVFLFISGDTDPEKWEIAEKKEGLVNSFLATNYPTATFYQDLKLSSFPRYLIFDTSGQLITERAPGPNSDTFKEKINELLKQ